jgi:dCTP deaminase
MRALMRPFLFFKTMLLNDKEISILAENDIIFPFVGEKTRELDNGTKALSYGLSHAGYDLRLSPKGFMVIDNTVNQSAVAPEPLDVKAFNKELMVEAEPVEQNGSTFFVMPPFSYALGVSVELLTMPPNIMGLTDGKSTYARQGTIINVTPIEPGWSGHLTICIVNPLAFPVRIYANEGIVQVMFARLSSAADQDYGQGKYQNQGANVAFAAV